MLISSQPTHFNFICVLQFFPKFLHNILIWLALFQKLERFSFSRVIVKQVVLSLSLRGLTVICGTKQNEKMLFVSLIQIGNMRNGNISILNQKSVIFKLVLLKIIQRRNCAVLIINVRSGMHDMTLNFKPENGVSGKERRLLCTTVPTMFL